MAQKGISPLLLPEAKEFYDKELEGCSSALSIEEMRATFAGPGSVIGLDTLQVTDTTIPGPRGCISLRIYSPIYSKEKVPVSLYIHGGGWMMGNNDTHAAVVTNLAIHTNMLVAAVDYRLAPEHPYPAAVEETWAAVEWLIHNAGSIGGDPDTISLVGDSAGGNLTAVMTLIAKTKGIKAIKSQVLICMVADLASFDTPSYAQFADDRYLPARALQMTKERYLQGADPKHPHASPLYADDFSGLPPAFVVTAEVDVLRDEAEAYAEKLKAARVPTTLKRFKGFFHVSMMDTDLFPEQGAAFYREVGDFIRAHA